MTDPTKPGLTVLRAVFPQLDEIDLHHLYAVCHTEEYPANTTIFRQGDPGDTFYVLVSGAVKVVMHTDAGSDHVDTLVAPTFFGEIALMHNQPRTADIISQGDIIALVIDRNTFEQHIKSDIVLFTAINDLIIRKLLSQQQQKIHTHKFATSENDAVDTPSTDQTIFVSYSRHDQEFAFKVADELRDNGFNLWLDQREIGVGVLWTEAIEAAMEKCAAMLLILSPSSVASRHVADEWHYFLDEGKPIVPIVYEPCRVPYSLRRIQHVSFVIKSYARAIEKLIAQLRATLA